MTIAIGVLALSAQVQPHPMLMHRFIQPMLSSPAGSRLTFASTPVFAWESTHLQYYVFSARCAALYIR